ncbi:MAG: mltB [Rickettsiaceae bacterium]|jgi:membrane-bound lytic murein transglycosylase B|nr:mltB [Rickettsiaceae bacterium]
MKSRLLKVAIYFIAIAFSAVACASTQSIENQEQEQFRGWLITFSQDARAHGISDNTIYQFLKRAEFLPKVIELDRKQPDTTKTFDEYIKSVVPERRLKEAKKQYEENKALLERIGKQYKVQPRFIIALWAVESDFGKITGNFSVVNSLATLAYEGRRAEFFRGELLNALAIIDKGHIQIDDMKGSWAGAMGQTQFMPSSYLKMSVDFDEDGKADIWSSREDVFASIANYLSTIGWDEKTTWGREVKLPQNFDSKLVGRTIEKTLADWNNLGVRKTDGSKLSGNQKLIASIVKPESDKNRAYIIYSNYKTVLHWNRSLYFATAVGLISDSIIK